MSKHLFFVRSDSKKYLVGRIRSIAQSSRGKSHVTLDAKVEGKAIPKRVVLELDHSRLDLARLPGSKLMVTANLEQAGDSLRATDLESFGIEYCQLAA